MDVGLEAGIAVSVAGTGSLCSVEKLGTLFPVMVALRKQLGLVMVIELEKSMSAGMVHVHTFGFPADRTRWRHVPAVVDIPALQVEVTGTCSCLVKLALETVALDTVVDFGYL